MPPVTPTPVAPSDARPSALDRVLRIFADVRAGEGGTALLLFVNGFLLLAGYYFLKTVREGLILTYGGREVKAYASAAQALVLILATFAFAALARRFVRFRLLAIVNLFFIANLALFFVLDLVRVPVSVPFFIWVGIFNLTVISSFWAFANDLFTKDQGERLFPIVMAGAATGSAVGSLIVGKLVEPLGTAKVMALAAVVFLVALGFTFLANRRGVAARPSLVAAGNQGAGGVGNGFGLILRDRYLLLIAALLFILNFTNTNGEFILDGFIEGARDAAVGSEARTGESLQAFEDRQKAFVGGFRADFFLYVNLVTLFLQFFVVSRVIKYVGVRRALFFLPLIALGGHAAMLAMPVLAVITVAKIAENGTNYSLQNTSNQALFLVTDREEKYKAKYTTDTFFVRFGDVASAGVVLLGSEVLAFSTSHYVMVNLALQVVLIAVVVVLVRQHRRRAAARGEESSPVPAPPAERASAPA